MNVTEDGGNERDNADGLYSSQKNSKHSGEPKPLFVSQASACLYTVSYSSLSACFHWPLCLFLALALSNCLHFSRRMSTVNKLLCLPAIYFTRSKHYTNLCTLHAQNNSSSRATEFHPREKHRLHQLNTALYSVLTPFILAYLRTSTY